MRCPTLLKRKFPDVKRGVSGSTGHKDMFIIWTIDFMNHGDVPWNNGSFQQCTRQIYRKPRVESTIGTHKNWQSLMDNDMAKLELISAEQ